MNDTIPGQAQKHPAPQRGRVALTVVLIGVALAPAAWLLQMNLSFLAGDLGCSESVLTRGVSSMLVMMSFGAFLLSLAALGASMAAFHATNTEASGKAHQARSTGLGRTRFMALSGMIVSSIFLAATAFCAVVPIVVGTCHG
jgi:hypothetical protein